MDFSADLKYTKEHEWIRIDGNTAEVGITEFAQSELGDVVFVEVQEVGSEVTKDEKFGEVESVKTVSDLFSPVSGKVAAVNEELEAEPEKVNEDSYGAGWMVKIEMSDTSEVDALLSNTEYATLVNK